MYLSNMLKNGHASIGAKLNKDKLALDKMKKARTVRSVGFFFDIEHCLCKALRYFFALLPIRLHQTLHQKNHRRNQIDYWRCCATCKSAFCLSQVVRI